MNKHKGFTLIELLIVITIIGILAVALLPRLLEGPARARDTARTASLNNIASTLQTYNIDFGEYPDVDGECTQKGAEIDEASAIVEALVDNGYMTVNNFPKDPQARSNSDLCSNPASGFWYKVLSDSGVTNAGYVLVADMENDRQGNVNADDIDGVDKIEDVPTALANFDPANAAHKGTQSVFAVTSR